jgi:unsaturated rhamnogalacturonyl hydrolase
VADHLIGTPVESYPFNWGEGVQMMGLVRAAGTAHAKYLDYVEKWARIYETKDLQALLNIGPQGSAKDRRGYCGYWSPATAILDLYQVRRAPEHLKLARGVTDFIRSGAERSPEGGLGHWQGSHQYWVDTLYMACPLLAEMGEAGEAADLILVDARHLQDSKSGLFYHMFDWQTQEHSEGFWGRGNGWVLMSLADTMEVLNKRDDRYARLELVARKLARGLAATQDREGMWHTVLDEPESYQETSATAMFVYGLLKLKRLGVLQPVDRAMALKAWKTINEKYVRDGVVTGVSAGTGPKGAKAYLTVALGSETWGTGA